MRGLFFYLLTILSCTVALGQDPGFSQFYANPVYLNPALVGTANQYRFTAFHRQQLAKQIGYTTTGISMDGNFRVNNIGWGLMVIQDSQGGGVLKNTAVNGSLAVKTKVSKKSVISAAVQFGFYQKHLDWQNLTFEDQLNERYGIMQDTNERFGRSRIANGDISMGVLFHSPNFFGGVAINHLNTPEEEFSLEAPSQLPAKYTIHFGGKLKPKSHVYDGVVVSPNFIYQKQGEFEYFNLGVYTSVKSIVFGAWYRVNNAAIFLVGLSKEKFRFGYSYDFVFANTVSTSNNAHELTVAYLINPPKAKLKSRFYKGKCPKFQQNLF